MNIRKKSPSRVLQLLGRNPLGDDASASSAGSLLEPGREDRSGEPRRRSWQRSWHPALWSKAAARSSALAVVLCGSLILASCGGGGSTTGGAQQGGDADLVELKTGRLVDVYGLRTAADKKVSWELFERDVLIGFNIQDERDSNSKKADSEVTYDFVGFDPENLQPKLLITREIGSDEFKAAFNRLDDNAYTVAPSHYGQNTAVQPFPIVARNGGIQLRFSKDLGLTEDFFVARDEQGRIIGIKNPEAVQLLEILGDPTDSQPAGDFRQIPARIAYKGDRIVLDPVLLGNEGTFFNVPNNANGLPESQNAVGSNIRIAIALEGRLRMRGLRQRNNDDFVGTNLNGARSIIRDFRSGNGKDSSSRLINGYVRDTLVPRLVGELAMRLERVDVESRRILLYKNGIKHDIDLGDVLRLYPVGSTGNPKAVAAVTTDFDQDRNGQHVAVLVQDATIFERFDPSNDPAYPTNQKDREAWLVKNAPTVVVSTEFNAEKDLIEYFARFSPEPLPDATGKRLPNKNIDPKASLILRFSKPIDLTTVRPLDSLIMATSPDSVEVLDPKRGTPHLIFTQIFDEDGSQTAVRVSPPQGLYLDDSMRKTNLPYYLHILGGLSGIRDLANNPVDFQYSNANRKDTAPPLQFWLDTTVENGKPRFANNRVVTIARRFLSKDEDEGPGGEFDFFGAVVISDGQASGRPTARVNAYVDDKNQLPQPSPVPPFAYCPSSGTMTLTGSTPFGQPIQNPLNPFGCRLQTVWRELDMSISRDNPFDFNLDVEQMWWAPFQTSAAAPPTTFDVYDRLSLYLGHSEYRPNNCVGVGGSLPLYSNSGLTNNFYFNFAKNLKPTATSYTSKAQVEERPKPHPAFENQELRVRNRDSVFEPTKTRRYLPLPTFKAPYFVWRDERSVIQGGGDGQTELLSPFNPNWRSGQRRSPFYAGDGLIGSIGLPLLADFWTYPDSESLPKDNPFRATGYNGWQISLTLTSSPRPYFRAYSTGYIDNKTINKLDPTMPGWNSAIGGWNPVTRSRTAWGDNSCYWVRADFLKRMSVMTYGFLDLKDPHANWDSVKNQRKINDIRLGPYTIAAQQTPDFEVHFEPPLSQLPTDTVVTPEWRAAAGKGSSFKLFDPLISGNAHIRKDASGGKWVSYQHTSKLSRYARDPNTLFDPEFQKKYDLDGTGVEFMNWRFIFENNVKVKPSTVPFLDSFAMTFRIIDK